MGHLGAILGHHGAILGPSWGHLEASLGHLGAILGPSGASWGRIEAILGPVGEKPRQSAKNIVNYISKSTSGAPRLHEKAMGSILYGFLQGFLRRRRVSGSTGVAEPGRWGSTWGGGFLLS